MTDQLRWQRVVATLAAIVGIAGCSVPDGPAPTTGATSAQTPTLRPINPQFSSNRLGARDALTMPVKPAPLRKGGGYYKIGKPHFANGRWYRPAADPSYDRTGIATWSGTRSHGRQTANGEIYDMDALTAAHPTLPMPSRVEITNLENGHRLILRLNDRGPYIEGRLVDVSRRAARLLGFEKKGTARVRVRYLGPAPLTGDDSVERRSAAALQRRLASNDVGDDIPGKSR